MLPAQAQRLERRLEPVSQMIRQQYQRYNIKCGKPRVGKFILHQNIRIVLGACNPQGPEKTAEMNHEKEEQDTAAHHRYAGRKLGAIAEPVLLILFRSRAAVLPPHYSTAHGMPDKRCEKNDFDSPDDGVGNEELGIRFVHLPAVVDKEKKVAHEMLGEERAKEDPRKAHQNFLAD